MESFEELRDDITSWIDERIDEAVKTAVDQANKDLMADLDGRFAKLEFALNNLGGVIDSMGKDVASVSDSMAKLMNEVLKIPEGIVDQVNAAIGRINPFHLP